MVVDEYGADKWVKPENCAAVIIPTVLTLPFVPIPEPPLASPPINLPVDDWYFKNLPSTFTLSLSTSSKNSRRTSPPPPCS